MPPSTKRYHPARPRRGPFQSRPVGHLNSSIRYNRPQPSRRFRSHHRKVLTPASNENIVIFPYKSGTFDTSSYHASQNDHKVTLEEINKVLNEIQATRLVWNKKFWRTFWCYVGSLLLAIGGFIVLMIFVLSKEVILIPIGIFVFIIIAVCTFICVFLVLAFYDDKAIEESKKVIEKYNPEFALGGLKWNLPAAFPQWIELWNEFKTNPHVRTFVDQRQNIDNELIDRESREKRGYNIQDFQTRDSEDFCIPITKEEM